MSIKVTGSISRKFQIDGLKEIYISDDKCAALEFFSLEKVNNFVAMYLTKENYFSKFCKFYTKPNVHRFIFIQMHSKENSSDIAWKQSILEVFDEMSCFNDKQIKEKEYKLILLPPVTTGQ